MHGRKMRKNPPQPGNGARSRSGTPGRSSGIFFFDPTQQPPGRSEEFVFTGRPKTNQEQTMNYAKIMQIHNNAMKAHEAGVEAARGEIEEKKEGESEEAAKARIEAAGAKLDMLEFTGAHELEQQLFQALSKVQEKEGQTQSAMIQNI
jgi:hypothetical protein